LIFTSLIWPAFSAASFSRTGLTIRHGPHHGAHTSTRTGVLDISTTSAKSLSPAWTIQGNGWPHLPQTGLPSAVA
jgi:hypothetical protein